MDDGHEVAQRTFEVLVLPFLLRLVTLGGGGLVSDDRNIIAGLLGFLYRTFALLGG